MSTNSGYKIITTEYAERHFIKSFKKKYKTLWNETFLTIEVMLSHIEKFLNTSKVEKIHKSENCYIAKCEFKIFGSSESSKTSGNRIIIYVDEEKKEVQILLLYTKTDVRGSKETERWEKEIKENHKEIYSKFNYQI